MAKAFDDDNSSQFIDRKWLAETGTRFCIEGAELFTQRDGNIRWYLTIWIKLEEVLEARKLTFDRTEKRDRNFNRMNDTQGWPVHSWWLERGTFKAKGGMTQPYYELMKDEGVTTCPCGDLDKLNEPEDHPF